MKTDHAYWRSLWRAAQSNMPYWIQKTDGRMMGQTSLLMRLLGFKSHASTGSPASLTQAYHTCLGRGTKPKDPQRARLLEMLAGPHGSTYVRVIAIQRGIRLERYTQWPKN